MSAMNPKLFLVASQRLRSCDRRYYARGVCRSPCYRLLYEKRSKPSPEKARARQKKYASTEKGRETRRNFARCRLLANQIESQIQENGAIDVQALLFRCQDRFGVGGNEAELLVRKAVALYCKRDRRS